MSFMCSYFDVQAADTNDREDEHSILIHMATITKEMQKLRPDMGNVKDALGKTFHHRQRGMEGKSVEEALADFPFLGTPSLVRDVPYVVE